MNDLKLCGIVLCCIVILSVFKGIKSEYSLFIRIGITLLVSVLSIALFTPILEYIDEITKGTKLYAYLPSLIKILGIAIIAELTTDICVDAGENSIASKVSLFARAEILILTLPLIKELFKICQGLIE